MFSDWELSGKISVEELGFFHNKLDPQQHNNYLSAAFEPEIYKEWDNGKQSFIFVPFFRYSQHDNRRTHFDIRELTWLVAEQDWGTVGLFILPGFRERTFSGAEGRLRTFPEISVGDASYEKHGIEKQLAYAARWAHTLGDWDIGLSHFMV